MWRTISRGLAGVGAGLLVSSLMGSGLLAVITEQFAFSENRFETNDIAVTAGVAVAPLGAHATCADVPDGEFVRIADGNDHVVNGLGDGPFDIDMLAAVPTFSGPAWCLWNYSPVLPATISGRIVDVSSTEVGECGPTELAAEQDQAGGASCADGAPGEFFTGGSTLDIVAPSVGFGTVYASYSISGAIEEAVHLGPTSRESIQAVWTGTQGAAVVASDALDFTVLLNINFGLEA